MPFVPSAEQHPLNESIENLLLDLGGVLVDIDFMRMARAFEKIGIERLEEVFSHKQQMELFDRFDRGQISEETFRNELLGIYHKKHMSSQEFDEAWNQIIVDMPQSVISCLQKIRKRYRLYLLSNTNSIHIRYLYNYLHQHRGVDNFEALFDGVYYSFRMGSRKPETKIFQQVIDHAKIDAARTLFIDDTMANIEAAKKIGFQVFPMPQGSLLPDVICCE